MHMYMRAHTHTVTSTQLGIQLALTTVIRGLYVFATGCSQKQEFKDQDHLALVASGLVQTQGNPRTGSGMCSRGEHLLREDNTNPGEETLWVP